MTLIFSNLYLTAQRIEFRDNIDKDSLFNVCIKNIPLQMQDEYTTLFKQGNEQEKDFLLFMISLPKSSKIELIANYESKSAEITALKTMFQKLVPKNTFLRIEFQAESKILTIPESVTIHVYKKRDAKEKDQSNVVRRFDDLEEVSGGNNLMLDSEELKASLKTLNWNMDTLDKLKSLLKQANYISIENLSDITIGFARSGMGLYSYKLFDQPLDAGKKKLYNDGCMYILYKDNIVLEYGGGVIGGQCFEE